MRRNKTNKVLLVFFVVFIVFAFSLLPTKRALVFQYENSGKILAYLPIHENDTFQMKYTHSIHLSDVYEGYRVTKDEKIQQIELIYEDFAVGMPENASDGQTFVEKNGKYYIENMNIVFPSFDLRTGKVRANHTIVYKGQEYPLSRYIKPGTWVRINIQHINLWQQWRGVKMID